MGDWVHKTDNQVVHVHEVPTIMEIIDFAPGVGSVWECSCGLKWTVTEGADETADRSWVIDGAGFSLQADDKTKKKG